LRSSGHGGVYWDLVPSSSTQAPALRVCRSAGARHCRCHSTCPN
jgi:hypothetical protein